MVTADHGRFRREPMDTTLAAASASPSRKAAQRSITFTAAQSIVARRSACVTVADRVRVAPSPEAVRL
jgi:hypothetical protein